MSDDITISFSPSNKEWQVVTSGSSATHIFQTLEWAEIHARLRKVRTIKVVAYWKGHPVAALLCFGGRFLGMNYELFSGGSGGGGGPIIIDDIPPSLKVAVYKLIIASVFSYAEKNSFIFCNINTYPGDGNEPIMGVSRRIRYTPMLILPASEKIYLKDYLASKIRYKLKKSGTRTFVRDGTFEDLRLYHGLQSRLVERKKMPRRYLNRLDELESIWSILSPRRMLKLYIAAQDEQLVGGAVVLFAGKTVFYKSGVLNEVGRRLGAGYAIQLQIIRDAIISGYRHYNMVGGTNSPSDPRYPITQFKLGFGAELVSFFCYFSERRGMKYYILRLLSKLTRLKFDFRPVIYP